MSDWLEDHTKPLRAELAALRAQLEEATNFCQCFNCNAKLPKDKAAVRAHIQDCCCPPKVSDVELELRTSLAASELARKELREALEVIESIRTTRFFLVKCKCGWLGSSAQCHLDSNLDDADILCPKCMASIEESDLTPSEFAAAALSKPHSAAALEAYVQKRNEEKK